MNNYAAGDFGNQPDATFPALAIITISGFATKTGAKAFALSPPKKKTAQANNAANTRGFVVEAKPQRQTRRCAWPC